MSCVGLPRPRFGSIKDILKIPLFCWKMIVNCRMFPRHICCPVMPASSRRRRRSAERRYDPLFGIPVAVAADGHNQQLWKPYSPAYIGLKEDGVQSRCFMDPADCFRMPDHPCCDYYRKSIQQRTFHIGPLVQPSLLENWMLAIFEFGAKIRSHSPHSNTSCW